MNVPGGMAALGFIGFLIWLAIGAAGLVLTVLWIVLPFSVFAIRRQVEEQEAILLRIEADLARLADASGGSSPARTPASPAASAPAGSPPSSPAP